MILVDTGPLVALFDPQDESHARCVTTLELLREPLGTTPEVLTEAFYLLSPGSRGSGNLIQFIADGGLSLWFLSPSTCERAFELMGRYADQPMDFADASLVVMAEMENARKIFTLDRNDFSAYRIRRGHRQLAFDVIQPQR